MSILSDINELSKYRDKIPSINTVDELQEAVSASKDIIDLYVYDLKGLPREIQRWDDYLQDIGLYSRNTDNESLMNSLIFNGAKDGSVAVIDASEQRLRAKMAEVDAISNIRTTEYFIGDVGVDYLFNPNPSYSSSAVSTPIVTSELQDTLNEDVENNNTTISTSVVLRGDDKEDRLNKLLDYRNKKARIKLVFNNVYDSVVITSINPVYDGSIDTLRIDLSFEDLFIATLQRTKEPLEAFKQPEKANTSSGKQGTKIYVEQQEFALTQQ